MGYDPQTKISEILKSKRGRVKHAPLDPGSPGWEELQDMTWGDIEEGAKRCQPGYNTIRKLLSDSRFNK